MTSNTTNLTEDSFENIRNNLLKFGGGRVSLHKDETTGIATILLDHPEKRNAMSGIMMVQLRDCIEVLEKWKDGKAVILYGNGNHFCSGADLNFVKANATPQAGLNMSTWMQDALSRLQRLPLISLCLLQGPCLGGGAEISVFCDFMIVAEDVKYGFVQGKMGITTAWGGGTRLAAKIGQHKALDLLLTAKILTANECVDIGLAETVIPTKDALGKTFEWLAPRLKHHHSITRAMKEIMLLTYFHTYEDSLRLEKLKFAPFWGGHLNQDALKQNVKHIKETH